MAHCSVTSQIAFKHVLLATDFSSTTALALPHAVEIARRSSATIHVVHMIQPDIYPLVPPSAWPEMAQDEQNFRESSKKQIEQELQGLPYDFTFRKGKIWPNLSSIIEDKGIDLIVLGTHGRTGIGKVLVGSVAEEIFRKAACPVLTVSPSVTSRATHASAAELNRILYATDFSPESLRAARYAIYLAGEHRAELIFVHSVGCVEAGQVNAAMDTLREIVPAGAGLASRPICIVEDGVPSETIVRVAKKQSANMIVLGVRESNEHARFVTHLSISTAYSVLTQAICPMLTVRS